MKNEMNNEKDIVTNQTVKQIDLGMISRAAWKHRRAFLIGLPAVFVLSCLFIVCIPRYYRSTVKLAPEMSSFSGSSLSEVASSFGIDIGSSPTSGDAIFPELYPELVSSSDFVTSLFTIPVTTIDGSLHTTYYDYLLNHQQKAWWTAATDWLKRLVLPTDTVPSTAKANPFRLTRKQYGVAKTIGQNVKCSVDKKNYVIAIEVEAQDPLICATMADSVKGRLQEFITAYRTKKALNDLHYTQRLQEAAKKKYEEARRAYGAMADANRDIVLTSYRLKAEDLENEMQLQYNNYTALTAQLQAAHAKVQENTPAFTTLQTSTVPVRPAGPKRMLFVLAMMLVGTIVITLYAAWRE